MLVRVGYRRQVVPQWALTLMRAKAFWILFLITVSGPALAGEPLTVAVASNFRGTAGELASTFQARTGHATRLVTGSSGKLYAQIVNGAPFDVFLSADAERPKLLEEQGLIVPGSRRVYALGRLVLWSRDPRVGDDCIGALARGDGARIAIANPDLAPYGIAAREYLEERGLWDRLQPDLLIGENVLQAFLFAARGGATFALTAASVTDNQLSIDPSCSVPVPANLYRPIEQQVVLLARSAASPGAQAFMEFLGSEDARRGISQAGYSLPEVK